MAPDELDLDDLAPGGSAATEEDVRQLVDELVRLGPTFVKLGQLLSTRADLLPPVYVEALSRLRDDVQPLDLGVATGSPRRSLSGGRRPLRRCVPARRTGPDVDRRVGLLAGGLPVPVASSMLSGRSKPGL